MPRLFTDPVRSQKDSPLRGADQKKKQKCWNDLRNCLIRMYDQRICCTTLRSTELSLVNRMIPRPVTCAYKPSTCRADVSTPTTSSCSLCRCHHVANIVIQSNYPARCLFSNPVSWRRLWAPFFRGPAEATHLTTFGLPAQVQFRRVNKQSPTREIDVAYTEQRSGSVQFTVSISTRLASQQASGGSELSERLMYMAAVSVRVCSELSISSSYSDASWTAAVQRYAGSGRAWSPSKRWDDDRMTRTDDTRSQLLCV